MPCQLLGGNPTPLPCPGIPVRVCVVLQSLPGPLGQAPLFPPSFQTFIATAHVRRAACHVPDASGPSSLSLPIPRSCFTLCNTSHSLRIPASPLLSELPRPPSHLSRTPPAVTFPSGCSQLMAQQGSHSLSKLPMSHVGVKFWLLPGWPMEVTHVKVLWPSWTELQTPDSNLAQPLLVQGLSQGKLSVPLPLSKRFFKIDFAGPVRWPSG